MKNPARSLLSLIFLFGLWFSGINAANAGEFCSAPPFNGVVDGTVDYTATVPALDPFPTQITIDTNCTFQNFTATNPLTATLNFQTNDPSIYLIIFDNVVFTGNMACASIDHKIWFVNGSDYGSQNNCQELFLSPEAIDKLNPVGTTAVTIGEPFTYTLTFPSMLSPLGDPSPDQLRNVVLWDDLAATGADLSFVGINAYYLGTGAPVTLIPEDQPQPTSICGVWTPTNLCYKPIPVIQPGEQIVAEITVVANDSLSNVAGASFFNTAKWWFDKDIDVDGDGTPESYFQLPGEWGETPIMTIAEPNLVMTKTADQTTLNFGIFATFTLDIQNVGGSDAYNVTVVDRLPDTVNAGMCNYDPTTGPITAQVFTAGGAPATSPLIQGLHYTVAYNTGTCELTFNIISPVVTIGPTEYLRLTFQSQLDNDSTADPFPLTNIAAATQWFSQDPGSAAIYRTYNEALTDGTPATVDHEDSYTITTTLSGYFFQKTVINNTTGADPATTAAPGDELIYRIRLFNLDQTFNGITIEDVLDPAYFDLTSFAIVSLAPGSDFTAPTAGNGGLLTINGFGAPLNSVGTNNLPGGSPSELIFDFRITLLSSLANGTIVPNFATLDATNEVPAPVSIVSDDPFLNGIALPYSGGDVTNILIQTPGPPSKVNNAATATIGEQFSYTITIPEVPVNVPLYDVIVSDDLDFATTGADLSLVSATATLVSGGSYAITNTGTATSLVLEDLATGVDIPAGDQVTIVVTVELQNTLNNQAGTLFSNTASYTYNRADGNAASQRSGGSDTAPAMTILEPNIINVTKTADNLTPAVGSTIRYAVTLEAEAGANLSDVFDVTLTDTLDLGLVYVGNPTVTGAGNIIAAPDITGDGIATPQTLVWGLNSDISSDIDIVAGDTITIEYDVQVLNSVIAGTALSNSIVAQWTGIDGAAANERDGSDGIGGLNDYITAPVAETVTTPILAATVSKARTSDTFDGTDANVRVGDFVEYTLTISMPEGTLGNMQLVDTLPQGLQYEGIVSINGNTGPPPFVASPPPFVHADITAASAVVSGNAATDPTTTVTWSLGDITNLPDNGLNDDFVIVYRARVLNNVFPHASLNIPLVNTVVLSFDTAAGTTTLPGVTAQINVLQPQLAVSKAAVPAGGDDSIVPGEVIQYTVDLTNNGTSPAYDVVLQDTIPDGLRTAGITVTNIYLVSAGPAPGLTIQVPVYDAGTGLATWDFGPATEYTIPAGDTLRIVYEVQADAGIASGLTLTNAAVATTWYSFDNNAVPVSGILNGVAEVYGPSNTASTTLFTGSPPTKALVSPTPASPDATIGEEVVYQIMVPGAASSASLYDVAITDALDANLAYVSATVTGGIGVTNTSTAGQMNIAIDEIPAGQQAVIELRARIQNIASAQGEGANIDNAVSYTFAYTPGGTTQPALTSTDIVTVNVVEPLVSLVKAVTNTTSPGQPPVAGDVLRYTLTLTASGGVAADDFSDAFDVSIEDTLSLGLVYNGNPTVSGAGNTIATPTTAGDGVAVAQTLNWNLADLNADIDIPEGTAVTVTYDVLVLNTVIAGQVLSNAALARWTGLDGADANERDGSGTPAYNDYFTAPVIVQVTVPDNTAVVKGIVSETFGAVDGNVRIGDIIDYSLRISLQEGLTAAVNIVDTLPQGLQFEEMVSINGNTVAPFTPVLPFSHANIALPTVTGNALTGPSSVTWNIGDITNAADADPANDEFVIVYRVRVLNDAFVIPQAASTALGNSVDFSYNTVAGTTTQNAIATATLQQPILTVNKQATPAGGDTVIDASEVITYTVDIVNSGQAPAYDVTLQDIIPAGLRTAGVTVTGIYLVSAGPAPGLPLLAPAYDPLTGIANWDLGTGVANAYMVPANDTLRIVYQVQADATLAPNMTMTNVAQVQVYYSLDSDDIPVVGGVTGVPQVYGVTNTASTTLTTAGPLALNKENPIGITTVQVGDTFTYSITVPATPMPTALNDVIIYDDLSASAADLSLVSTSISTTFGGSFTLTNSGTATSLVLQDLVTGIDIPAGGQVTVDITVVVQNTANNNNPAGVLFNNTATYTYNQVNDDIATVQPGPGDTTADMQIVGPYSMVMTKTGPAQMNLGVPATFTMDVLNTGSGTAYDMTVTDVLPNLDPAPGGMCDNAPTNITAQIIRPDTTVLATLVENTDFTVSFAPAPACTLTITMTSLTAALPANHRLLITYDALIDADNPAGTILINYAGATQWFTGDTAGAGATGEINTYNQTLSLTNELNPDHEDWHQVTTLAPVLTFEKSVSNLTTGLGPVAGLTATPGDDLHYIIALNNTGTASLTNFSITDEVDVLNASPWFAPGSMRNITVSYGSADTTNTNINGGANGTGLLDVRNLVIEADDGVPGSGPDQILIEFDITLASVIPNSTTVLNQAQLDSIVTGTLVSDDPVSVAADDPTEVLITSVPVLDVQKTVADITNDPASLAAGDTLRYTITVKNIAGEDAVNATLQDSMPANTTYVPNSTTLNGNVVADVAGVSPLVAGMLINAPEDTTPGYLRADPDPLANNTATITFDVVVSPSAVAGLVISNQGFVDANGVGGGVMPQEPTDDPATPADDDPTLIVVDVTGVGTLSGFAWHDANFNNVQDPVEGPLEGWFVDIFYNGALLTNTTVDATGTWQVTGLQPNVVNGIPTGDTYEIRFRAPDAVTNSASMGQTHFPDAYLGLGFARGQQRITGVNFGPGSNTPDLNMPIDPDGVVYDSVTRAPVPGATLTLVRVVGGVDQLLASSCFNDPSQQNQVTLANGYYKFDVNFTDASCPSGADYVIRIGLPASGSHQAFPSVVIPPTSSDATAAYSVPACTADAVGASVECEAVAAELAPPPTTPVGPGTTYYLHVTLSQNAVPVPPSVEVQENNQLFNNHIPLDPELATAVTITKTASLLNVKRGDLVPYTITATNSLAGPLPDVNIIDIFPAGFKYVKGSARLNGVAVEPVINGQILTWPNLALNTNTQYVIKLLLAVSSGVSEGKYVNRALIWDNVTNQQASQEATATVRVVPDPTFDCTDVIGKVYDDKNMNGYQDNGEKGIANVRVISARGLIMKTDANGRFHITCAVVPNQDRGSNFILKVDERSLPSGYRVITENPRVQRATRGKMMKFNFGAAIHRVIRLDIADPVFEKNSTELRMQWKPRLNLLIRELGKGPAILRISYLGDTESSGLVNDRIDAIRDAIMELRDQADCCEMFTVETEIFWRRGRPAQ